MFGVREPLYGQMGNKIFSSERIRRTTVAASAGALLLLVSCGSKDLPPVDDGNVSGKQAMTVLEDDISENQSSRGNLGNQAMTEDKGTMTQKATLGGGCFWCVEEVYQQVNGVKSVVSGYAGGHQKDPTYKEVCQGTTGHAEVVQIEFDPDTVTYARLLELFWLAHDPTTLNRQGNDVGTQYRSIILWHDENQRETALESRTKAQEAFSKPIVTEIARFTEFYAAEDDHQDFYQNNKSNPYCRMIISPKLDKLKKELAKP